MNLLLTIEYDGAAYCGWQRQPRRRSVQSELEKAARLIFKSSLIKSMAAGRTDSGVHACAQAVSLSVTGGRAYPLKKVPLAFNAVLPQDISVMACRRVTAAFSARYCARGKQYEYFIWNSPYRSVWRQKYAWHIPHRLNIVAMRRAARFCLGTHDFKAFHASGGTQENTVATLTRVRITAAATGAVSILVEGDRFLYKMVRTLVGTLVEIGRGKRPPACVGDVIAAGDRRHVGETAPAHGLFLRKIIY